MVYIAVGSANNALQQFPPFLQELIAINKTMRLIIVSIDSLHEFPPLAFTNINNLGKRVEIFVYKCNVCVISDKHREKNECIHPNKDVHIYSQLHDMNEYILSVGGSLLFNMYSGANISLLAETFDAEYINNLDQIVYGIGGRINHGCFFDMHTDLAYFATRIDNVTILHSTDGVIKRPLIKMFNYYKHLLNKTIGSDAERRDISSYPRHSLKYINAQINNIVVSLWDDFKNTHLFMLRQIYNKLHIYMGKKYVFTISLVVFLVVDIIEDYSHYIIGRNSDSENIKVVVPPKKDLFRMIIIILTAAIINAALNSILIKQ